MKRLRTINQVSNIGGTIGAVMPTTKVTMRLKSINHEVIISKSQNEGVDEDTAVHRIVIVYEYTDENGAIIPVLNPSFTIPNDGFGLTVDGMYDVVSSNIPSGLAYRARFEKEIIEGAKLRMAESTGEDPSDIEEII